MSFVLLGLLLVIAIIILLSAIQGEGDMTTSWIIYLVLPFLPLLLLYPVFRKRYPGLELRANQALTGTLYVILITVNAVVGGLLLKQLALSEDTRLAVLLVVLVVSSSFSAAFYPYFRRWVQRHLLGISLDAGELARSYTGRIVSSLEASQLRELWTGSVLPSLMVRQAALLRLDEDGGTRTLIRLGVDEGLLPPATDLVDLLAGAGRYRPLPEEGEALPYSWVRLVLKLTVQERLVGICLLGRRDPDDFYSAEEIPLLQALMDQTALALDNIAQTERLHTFHQSNIQRYEEEQAALARDLHDDVLSQMAVIPMLYRDNLPRPVLDTYLKVIAHIRGLVNGLRPPLIEYGLHLSLSGLVEDLQNQYPAITIHNQVQAGSQPRYTQAVEVQIFRIAQEACQNAIRRGKASQLTITGKLGLEQIELNVQDNGQGFETTGSLDLNHLLARKHFGLANMFERTQIIGGYLVIQSVPGKGTDVHLEWTAAS